MGETAPLGNRHVVAPLAFLRGALCLNAHYHKRAGCAQLDADGYAHHAYTKRAGPRYRPPDPDDVTIGVARAPRRARSTAPASAGALRAAMPIYLTEFGIQSKPDPFVGVSLARQAEYLSISERSRSPTRACSRSRSTCCATTRRARARASRATAASSPACATPTGASQAGLRRLPAAARASATTGASDVSGAACGPPAPDDVAARAPPGRGLASDYKTVQTNPAGVFGLKADARARAAATASLDGARRHGRSPARRSARTERTRSQLPGG